MLNFHIGVLWIPAFAGMTGGYPPFSLGNNYPAEPKIYVRIACDTVEPTPT
jgi:hypothetical protein